MLFAIFHLYATMATNIYIEKFGNYIDLEKDMTYCIV
jgi:hypothetical protein